MSKDQKQKLDREVAAALHGNEDAADRVEMSLPLSHEALRTGLKETPMARFAPRMRLILALFDDTVMPIIPEPRATNLEKIRVLGR